MLMTHLLLSICGGVSAHVCPPGFILNSSFQLQHPQQPQAFGSNDTTPTTPYSISTEIPPSYINRCVCGTLPKGILRCEMNQGRGSAYIMKGYCMSVVDENGVSNDQGLIGTCSSSLFLNSKYNEDDGYKLPFFIKLPDNFSELNKTFCNGWNKTGFLCSECKEGYEKALMKTSFELFDFCLQNVTVYSTLERLIIHIIPTTVFFVFILLFGIRVTSAPMNAFIFFCHMFTGLQYRIYISAILNWYRSMACKDYDLRSNWTLADILANLFGLWKMDFFPNLFYYSEPEDLIEVSAVCFIEAFYSLVLVVFTYVFIQLHAYNFKPVVICWSPFHQCFTRLRRSIDPKSSVIGAFATFILLSYTRLIDVSISLLYPAYIYNMEGKMIDHTRVYLDTDVYYFTGSHISSAITAVIVLSVLVGFLPLMLLLYPRGWCQRLLERVGINGHGLHTFADAFYGCYKDGTEGTRDYRFFSALYLLLRFFVLFPGLFLSISQIYVYYTVVMVELLCMSLAFALLRPYKKEIFNALDACFFAILMVVNLLLLLMHQETYTIGLHGCSHIFPLIILIDILCMVPLVYIACLTVYCVAREMKLRWNTRNKHITLEEAPAMFTETMAQASVPHRLVHPEYYKRIRKHSSIRKAGSFLKSKSHLKPKPIRDMSINNDEEGSVG